MKLFVYGLLIGHRKMLTFYFVGRKKNGKVVKKKVVICFFFSFLFLRVGVFFLLKCMVFENEELCVKVELGSFELKFDIVVFPISHDHFTGKL